ncbi:MAG: 3D domain-containing protein [Gemmatimonadota bacterium]|nr:MAG: 3D domain-containing protein [Gemmatimonadota bacterium]
MWWGAEKTLAPARRLAPAIVTLAVSGCVFYQPIEPSLVWHPFEATAYCDYGFTASGVYVREGIVAGDPRVLPLGSEIDIKLEDGEVLSKRQVMDKGSAIKGYIIDIWMPTCEEAMAFGRREVKVRVRRKGTLKS